MELNKKGEDAFKKGEYIKALNYYSEALNIGRSIEHMDSMGKNIINIAYIYYKIGEIDKAHNYADQIIHNIPLVFGDEYLIKAMFIKSLLYFEEKNAIRASFWLEKALYLCEKNKCSEICELYNLKARIFLMEKDIGSAMENAKKALEFSKKINNLVESANAYRIIADIEFLIGDYNASIKSYENAFYIDKDLELGEKMVKDLVGIASNYEKINKIEDALTYYRRALSICEGTGNKVMERSISEILKGLQKSKSD